MPRFGSRSRPASRGRAAANTAGRIAEREKEKLTGIGEAGGLNADDTGSTGALEFMAADFSVLSIERLPELSLEQWAEVAGDVLNAHPADIRDSARLPVG